MEPKLTPHLLQLLTLPPTGTGMVDIRKPEVNDLEKTRPLFSQHISGRKVPVLDSQEVDDIHLRKQEKSAMERESQHNPLQITTRITTRHTSP